MLKTLLSDLRLQLDFFFDQIELDQVDKILDKLKNSTGTLFLTGVGKSGHIAKKLAATFVSTGTKASYFCPSHAMHGDLGILTPNDILILLSKSGESEELLQLIPSVKKKGVYTIGVVSQVESRLSRYADCFIHLPVQKEICPYDLAPTTSTAIQLIFGDCLAIALMKKKQFSLSDFAANHPAGLIGRKIIFKVSDLMLKGEKIPLCKKTDRLIDVLHELSNKKCGCLLVVEEKKLIGIFTDGDLRRTIEAFGEKGLRSEMSELMNPSPRFISPDLLALNALHQMEEDPKKPITVLPVVHNETIVGLIRMHDILQVGLTK